MGPGASYVRASHFEIGGGEEEEEKGNECEKKEGGEEERGEAHKVATS